MRKVLYIIPLLILALLGLGCDSEVPADPRIAEILSWRTTVVDPAVAKVNDFANWRASAFQTWYDQVNRDINDLKNKQTTVAGIDYGTRVTALENKVTALETAVAALKAASAAVTPGQGTATGSVVMTTNPVAIPQIFSSSAGGVSSPWIVTINNQSSTWQYVKPMVNLNVASGQPSSTISDITIIASGGNCSLTGSLLVPGNYNFSPSNMATVATSSIMLFTTSGCNGTGEFYIGPGQTQSYNFQIQGFKTPNPILWNVSCTVSSRSM